MITFRTNSNNDIYVSSGEIAIASELQAIIEVCENVAKSQLGEMFLAQDRGIPNFQTIWTSSANVAQFEAYLKRSISAVDGVIGIKSLNVQVSNNVLSYQIEIETIYGTGVIGGV